MKWKRFQGPLFLLLAAMIWGTAFVAQDVASEHIGSFAFNGTRMMIGSIVLMPVVWLRTRRRKVVPNTKRLFSAGALCGVLMFLASSFQQIGITLGTSAGKSGFLTALYVVFVPLFGLFQKRKVRREIWAAVVLAVVGMYFLCVATPGAGLAGVISAFTFSRGDLLTVGCAVLFALHILTVARVAPGLDGVQLSCVQFFIAGALSLIGMVIFEKPTLLGWEASIGAILYSGILSCGVAYTFQILGQKTTPPTIASILLCLEAVFAVLSDVIILKTRLTAEEICGCVMLFCAILVSNLSGARPRKKSS